MGSVQTAEDRLVLPGRGKNKSNFEFNISDKFIQRFQNRLGHQVPYLFLDQQSPVTCIYFHGNDENLTQCSFFLSQIATELNVNVICMEYPGYSVYELPNSQQKNKENHYQTILDNCDDFIKSQKPDQSYIIFGRSLGSCPALYCASKFNPLALVLVSAIYSMKALFQKHATKALTSILESSFRSDKVFQNEEFSKKVQCPTLIIHGQSDRVVPVEHGQKLAEQIGNNNSNVQQTNIVEMQYLKGLGHNDIFPDDQLFIVKEFMTKYKLIKIEKELKDKVMI